QTQHWPDPNGLCGALAHPAGAGPSEIGRAAAVGDRAGGGLRRSEPLYPPLPSERRMHAGGLRKELRHPQIATTAELRTKSLPFASRAAIVETGSFTARAGSDQSCPLAAMPVIATEQLV